MVFLILIATTIGHAGERMVAREYIRHETVENYFDFSLSPSPILRRVRLTTDCSDLVSVRSVLYTSAPGQTFWHRGELVDGGYVLGDRFHLLRLNFYAPGRRSSACHWTVYGEASDEHIVSGERFAGVLRYPGGFQYRLNFPLPGEWVRSFRIVVPRFCGELDILEGGTVSEGVYDQADELTPEGSQSKRYTVNAGTGLRISSIQVTLNGPATLECTLPVYIR